MPEPDLTPRRVPLVENSRWRRIVTEIPAPATVPVLEKLHRYEPRAMQGQPLVVWNHASGFQVFDGCGNSWLDFSSGVLVTNAGHSHPRIVDAIVKQAQSGLIHNYCFPQEPRAKLVERIAGLLPPQMDKVFLLTTGSETIECCIKLCRTHGLKVGGRGKSVIVSFEKAFHGRTLGSQLAGGTPSLKDWIVNLDKDFVQVPFPDGYRTTDTSFDAFQRALSEARIESQNVAGVVMETFQGATAAFAPDDYMRKMRDWTRAHKILLVCDEVQAGFGRSGKMWGFEHYGIVPDLAAFGKGISGSMPLAAVAGPASIMDLHPPGSMSSTHTGNPVCAAAALASIDVIVEEGLVENAARLGRVLAADLRQLQSEFRVIGNFDGRGLVAAVNLVKPGTKEPDAPLAAALVRRAVDKGLLLFAPVGYMGAALKICPPLCITEEALLEGLAVLREAFTEVLAERESPVAAAATLAQA